MINKVILTGRLTATPEIRKTSSDVSVTSFSVAVQRQYKGPDGNYPTDFINCVAWRNTADFICRYFEKGQLIALVGSLQSRNYEDKTGAKRTAFEVVADEATFVEKKSESTGYAPRNDDFQAPAFASDAGIAPKFEEVAGDEDLPF